MHEGLRANGLSDELAEGLVHIVRVCPPDVVRSGLDLDELDVAHQLGRGVLHQAAERPRAASAALIEDDDAPVDRVEESPMDIEDEGSIEELAKDVLVSKAALQYRLRNL